MCFELYLLVFLPVQSRACGIVLELEFDVRHKVDAEVVAELFERLNGVEDALFSEQSQTPIP